MLWRLEWSFFLVVPRGPGGSGRDVGDPHSGRFPIAHSVGNGQGRYSRVRELALRPGSESGVEQSRNSFMRCGVFF